MYYLVARAMPEKTYDILIRILSLDGKTFWLTAAGRLKVIPEAERRSSFSLRFISARHEFRQIDRERMFCAGGRCIFDPLPDVIRHKLSLINYI